MACPTLVDPACVARFVISKAAGSVTGGVVSGLAGAIQSGLVWVVSHSVSWWVTIPSPDLSGEPAVGSLQRWLLPITVGVAVLAMLAAAGKIALSRKANPLIGVGSGLAIIAATSAVGVLLPAMLLRAGDAWSSWVLTQSTGGQFEARLTAVLSMSGVAPGVVIVLGIVAIILSAITAFLARPQPPICPRRRTSSASGHSCSALYTLLDAPNTGPTAGRRRHGSLGAGKSSAMYQLKDMMNAPPEGAPHTDPGARSIRRLEVRAQRAAVGRPRQAIYEQPQRGMTLQKLGFRLRLERERLGGWKLLAAFGWPFLQPLSPCSGCWRRTSRRMRRSSRWPRRRRRSRPARSTTPSSCSTRSGARSNDMRSDPDYEEQLGFTAEGITTAALTRVLAPDDDHALAVSVHDLDRCSSAHVVEVVEAMNQISNAAEDHRCAFVLGLDRDVVATSIEVVYEDTVARR